MAPEGFPGFYSQVVVWVPALPDVSIEQAGFGESDARVSVIMRCSNHGLNCLCWGDAEFVGEWLVAGVIGWCFLWSSTVVLMGIWLRSGSMVLAPSSSF